MPIEPISNPRLYKKVADQIAQLIQCGEYQRGQKLPGERNLITRLGVSRSSLREALISLEMDGLIEIRDRSGIFVLGEPETSELVAIDTTVFEVFSARELIEVQVATLAARHATAEHLDTLTRLLGEMVVCAASDPKSAEYDRQFHLTLAQACGNRMLLRTVELLWENTQSVMKEQPSRIKHSEATWQAVVIEHCDIFQAVRKKNPQGAQNAMQQHIEKSIKRLSTELH